MKVLVTGSNGFIGKNLIERLNRIEKVEVLTFTKNDNLAKLNKIVEDIDFIFHLAGVNRPKDPKEFIEGNRDLTYKIIEVLEKNNKKIPILFTSSTQIEKNNDYGRSKKETEKLLIDYSKKNNTAVYIYRLPNVFGKWSKPNYNTVIATWCYNITRDLPIVINNENTELTLVYIDDVVNSFVKNFNNISHNSIVMPKVFPEYRKSLGEIKLLLEQFKDSRKTLLIPSVGQGFERALYATYLSFLPKDKFAYDLKGYSDERGTFYEILKTIDSGQFSISTTKPGDIVRGNHYHNTKNEKFLVVKGKAIIELRDINTQEVVKYEVSDKKMQIVEMIPGYTHNVKNISDEELILFIWANEIYDSDNPDTYYLEV